MPRWHSFWQFVRWVFRISSTRSSQPESSKGIICNGGGFRCHLQWDIPVDKVQAISIDFLQGGVMYRATLTGVFPVYHTSVKASIDEQAQQAGEENIPKGTCH